MTKFAASSGLNRFEWRSGKTTARHPELFEG